jgi:hypothetical protein
MFPALLANLQEALHNQQLVYCVRIMSAGCNQGSTPTLVARNIPIAVYATPPEDEQVVVETCTGC